MNQLDADKKYSEIIKFMKNNKSKSFIFNSAISGIEDYNLSVDVVLKHTIIYLFNQVSTQKLMLDNLNVKN